METIHTGAAAITFPTTPEAFIAYQEQLIGRRLKENEWETVAAWVEAFNLSYEDGLNQDRDILVKGLDKLDELMARHENHEGVHKLLFLSKFSLDHFVFHSPPYRQRDAGWYNTAKPLQHKALRTVPSPSNTKPVLAI